jgi:signal transduction histidine kinase
LPEPKNLTPNDLRHEDIDSTLVRIEGVLVDMRRERAEQLLEMQIGLRSFVARLDGRNGFADVLLPGSRLALTGVYAGSSGNRATGRGSDSFELLLNRPADIQVLARPSWWTFHRVLGLSEVAALVLISALLWAFSLRRRVKVQMEIISQKIQNEATLEERARIARELHDTLEQSLAGIRMQLDALDSTLQNDPAKSRRILEMTCAVVGYSQEEARRSVYNLRTYALERGNLPAALSEMVTQLKLGWTGHMAVNVLGTPRPLPGPIEGHLLRIGQEAATNAIKHAAAREIRLEIEFEKDCARLAIIDDGCGFDPQYATLTEAGHFGFLGMRERAEKIGGQLAIVSAPGAGTRIQVTVPLEQS